MNLFNNHVLKAS